MTTSLRDIPIIDTDTHVVEPPDLWTSRHVDRQWGDRVPHVEWDEAARRRRGSSAASVISAAVSAAMAGWHEHPPSHPPALGRRRPRHVGRQQRASGGWTSTASSAQVLYPNVAVFNAKRIIGLDDDGAAAGLRPGLQRLPDRLGRQRPRPAHRRWRPCRSGTSTRRSPRSSAARRRATRASSSPRTPARFGLPELTDRYWDPMWASAQEKGLPVNFHIASGDLDLLNGFGHPDNGEHANYAIDGRVVLHGQRQDRSPS